MKKKKRFCSGIHKAPVLLLALMLVLASVLVSFGNGAGTGTQDTTEVKLELKIENIDELNDRFDVVVNLAEVPTDGLSGLSFKLSYPSKFKQAKAPEPGDVFNLNDPDEEKRDYGIDSGSTEANPYFIAFGSMNQESDGVIEKTGELVRFSFEPDKAESSLSGDANYAFSIEDPQAVLIKAGEGNGTVNYTVNTASVNYTPIASDIDNEATSDKNTINIKKPESGKTPKIKTETINNALKNLTEANLILDMSTDSTAESVIISKEGAQAISDNDKNLVIKTNAGQLVFSSAAVKALGENAEATKTGAKIEISLQSQSGVDASGNEVADVLNVSVNAMSNEKPIQDFNGGEVTVTVNIPEDLKGKDNLKAMFYDTKAGSFNIISGTMNEDGTFSFNTNHFSEYMIGAENTLRAYADAKGLKEGVTVKGQVASYNPKNATVIQLKQGEVVKYSKEISAETSGSGQIIQEFEISCVAAGTYDLVVTKACHLAYTITGVVVGIEDIDLTTMADKVYQTITLLAGDIDGSGDINLDDLNIVWNNNTFNKSVEEALNGKADIDGSSDINLDDLNIVWNNKNFNKGTNDCTFKFE